MLAPSPYTNIWTFFKRAKGMFMVFVWNHMKELVQCWNRCHPMWNASCCFTLSARDTLNKSCSKIPVKVLQLMSNRSSFHTFSIVVRLAILAIGDTLLMFLNEYSQVHKRNLELGISYCNRDCKPPQISHSIIVFYSSLRFGTSVESQVEAVLRHVWVTRYVLLHWIQLIESTDF